MTPEEKLVRDIKVTAVSRFHASARLLSTDKRMTIYIAFSSIFVVLLTILPYCFPASSIYANNINFVTIALSIIIIAISLIQYSNSNAVISEKHHGCALALNELRRKIEVGNVSHIAIVEEYNSILKEFNINHETADYYTYIVRNNREYNYNIIYIQWIKAKILFKNFAWDMLFLCLYIPILLYMYFSMVRPNI
jgi:hypothetical protein